MSAGRYDIKKLDRAASFSMKMILKNNGVVMDLSGYTAKASIKEALDDEESIVDFTCLIPDPSNGEIFLTLSPTNTLKLIEYEYYYDVILISGDYITRVIDGKVIVSPEVTENA